MNRAYLLTGGNLGDRQKQLEIAANAIGTFCGKLLAVSPIVETAAWGKTDQPCFLNQALELATALNPYELLEQLLRIEKKMGRERLEKNGPRLIDLDILLFNDLELNSPDLVIPHPQLEFRRFALFPLASIAARVRHPRLGLDIARLLEECTDPLQVWPYRG